MNRDAINTAELLAAIAVWNAEHNDFDQEADIAMDAALQAQGILSPADAILSMWSEDGKFCAQVESPTDVFILEIDAAGNVTTTSEE